MDTFVIEGGHPLSGTISIEGSKNAALPIMASTILADGVSTIKNVPDLMDVRTLVDILATLGVSIKRKANGDMEAKLTDESAVTAPYDMVRKMRASFAVLGPLVARRGRAKVSLPGGCVIGVRPIDLHLKGLKALGANIEIEHGYVIAEAKRLRGAEIYLGGAFGSTVLGTENILMAAVLAEGTTVIEDAACEPEVADLATFLNKMGAKISGIGSPRLVIEGVTSLRGAAHTVIPDRIEAATFMTVGAISRDKVTIENVCLDHMHAVIDKLNQMGVEIRKKNDSVCEIRSPEKLLPTDITTLSYPGFPTDVQAQVMALLAVADGISVITEKVYPDRFMHVAELNRLGANIRREGPHAIIIGTPALSGAEVMASDLRASAALVVAGLFARGETKVNRVYHIDRGYERIEEKLNALGARIKRIDE